jgi:hypothetical protein
VGPRRVVTHGDIACDVNPGAENYEGNVMSTPASLKHVVLTRFNLPSRGTEQLIRNRDGWLRERVGLFEQYCLPSMLGQTERHFSWIIYFDDASPQWLKDWAGSKAAAGAFIPIYRPEVPRRALLADIAQTGLAGETFLLTTNLDNDDGLALNFVEVVQAAAASINERTAIYLTRGLIRGPAGLYIRQDKDNAFCSVVEPMQAPVTCWTDWHNRLSQTMPTRRIAGSPAWLQVVHRSNVSNRTRGRLISPEPYRHLFADALGDVPTQRRAAILRDRVIDVPVRALRDASRCGVKRVAMGVLGKSGFDRTRNAVALAGRGTAASSTGGAS